MMTCNIIMSTCNKTLMSCNISVIILHVDIPITHVNIFILYVGAGVSHPSGLICLNKIRDLWRFLQEPPAVHRSVHAGGGGGIHAGQCLLLHAADQGRVPVLLGRGRGQGIVTTFTEHIGGYRGGGGLWGLQPPFLISKIKESIIKQRKKIEDNPLEKEEVSKSCMFI